MENRTEYSPKNQIVDPLTEELHVARFDSQSDVHAKMETVCLGELFASHEVREKKDGAMFSATTYKDNYRNDDNSLVMAAAIQDYDDLKPEQRADVLRKAQPFAYILYTTHSHRSEKKPGECFRLVLLIDRPLMADEVRDALKILGNTFGDLDDKSTREPSRAWWLPAAPQSRIAQAEIIYNKGRRIIVDDLLKHAPKPPEQKNSDLATEPAGKLEGMGDGDGRNNVLYLSTIGMRKQGLTQTAALKQSLKFNASFAEPLSEIDVAKLVRSAYGKDGVEVKEPDDGERTTWVDTGEEVGDITWLWPDRIPNGQVTILAGEPAMGKSVFALHVCGIATKGGQWPDGAAGFDGKGYVIWAEAEGGQAGNVQRAKAFGYKLERFINPLPGDRNLDDFRIDEEKHLEALTAAVNKYKPRLIVVDALAAAHRLQKGENDAAIHGVLSSLRAAACGVPVLVLHHLRKAPQGGRGELAIDDLRGSSAIIAAARSILAIDQPDKMRQEAKRVSHIKSNYGELQKPLGFQWEVGGLKFVDAPEPPVKMNRGTRLRHAILDYLADGKEHAFDLLKSDLEDDGFNEQMIIRAGTTLEEDALIAKDKRHVPALGKLQGFWRKVPDRI